MRRRRHTPQPLTSMIDVLFILLFASLARATAPDAAPEAPEAPEPTPVATPDAAPEPPVDAAPVVAPGYAAARELGLAAALEQLGQRPALVLRISAAGELVAIETGADQTLEVRVPLLERVPDRDVALAYLGDRSPDMQLCAVAARYQSIDNRLVVIAPEVAIADLSVALVGGLQRDIGRCAGGLAVIVEPVARKEDP